MGRVIVLQDRSRQGGLTVSRKASLIAAAKMLPSELGQVAEGALVPGYVASITEDSVFVRFLKDLTGRAGESLCPFMGSSGVLLAGPARSGMLPACLQVSHPKALLQVAHGACCSAGPPACSQYALSLSAAALAAPGPAPGYHATTGSRQAWPPSTWKHSKMHVPLQA